MMTGRTERAVPISPSELAFNQVAQGVRPLEALDALHETLDVEQCRVVLDTLIGAVLQAHPRPEETTQAIQRAGLKASHTPCVLLEQKPLPEALAAIRRLPKNEMRKAFRLLTALLGIADARRRAACSKDCHHWWHQDLGNPAVIDRLLAHP